MYLQLCLIGHKLLGIGQTNFLQGLRLCLEDKILFLLLQLHQTCKLSLVLKGSTHFEGNCHFFVTVDNIHW